MSYERNENTGNIHREKYISQCLSGNSNRCALQSTVLKYCGYEIKIVLPYWTDKDRKDPDGRHLHNGGQYHGRMEALGNVVVGAVVSPAEFIEITFQQQIQKS
ncbi:MAG: hypothetical protein WCR45_01275 [Bacteroidaceae bacterium]|nr:hypothetical protein [Bacteroidaceae bacterium]